MARLHAADAAAMFRACADPTRLRLLALLHDEGEICVGDLVAVLGQPQTTVSRHLAYLRRAGLARVRRDGVWKHYSLAPAAHPFHGAVIECLERVRDAIGDLARDRRTFRSLAKCCPRPAVTSRGRRR